MTKIQSKDRKVRSYFCQFFMAFSFLISSFSSLAEISSPISGQLKNGLNYTLLPLHDEKGHIEVRLKVRAGAVDELDHQGGVAHMVEHSVFHATEKYHGEKYPLGIMSYLFDNKWIRGQSYNAVTTPDSTTYMMTPPVTSNLEDTLDVLSQMVFHAKLTQEDLDSERKVIMEEWRQKQGVGNAMAQARTEAVRANSRYARRPVLGLTSDIENMPASELQQFYQTWYVPNNMILLIVGDFEPKEAEKLIIQYFSPIERRILPKRDYLDIELQKGLNIQKIQDPRSGTSQVAYIFRFDESSHKTQTEEGRLARLVDRLALAAISKRLRNQQSQMLEGVHSVAVRKSDIGGNSVAVGFFAGVNATAHSVGLQQIFTEIERLKQYSITEEELANLKEPVQAQLDFAKTNDEDRPFDKWIQRMLDSVLMDRPYLTQQQIANLIQPLLDSITTEQVNQQILQWLNTEDRVLHYQPPRKTEIPPFTEQQVAELEKKVSSSQIAPPEVVKVVEPMALESIESQGKIVSEKKFPEQNVVEWQLSNGDKVVWLKSPLAKDRTDFRAISSAGFKGKGLINWQAQFASQLIGQNAPLDWEIEQLNRWKEIHKVGLSIRQSETKLEFSGSAKNQKLAELLRLYYAYQRETTVKDGLDEVKEEWLRNLASKNEKQEERERSKAFSLLRFGVESLDVMPEKEAMSELTEDELNQQWGLMTKAPTTYYLMNNMEQAEVKALVENYLTDIPRGKAFESTQIFPISGKGESQFAMHLEPKADVRFWLFTPYQWQGKDAVLVSILRNIATVKLKAELRDKALGVYSLRFESQLNPQTARIESELSFTASPEKVKELVERAKTVLKNLGDSITEEDIKLARTQFKQAEQARLKESHVWLSRLILSEEQFGNPSYLKDMNYLGENISLENIKQIAKALYNEENQRIFTVMPIE